MILCDQYTHISVDKFQFSVIAKKITAIFEKIKNHKDGSENMFFGEWFVNMLTLWRLPQFQYRNLL